MKPLAAPCLWLGLVLAGCAVAPTLDVRPVTLVSDMPIERPAGADPYERGKEHLTEGRLGLALEEFRLALARGGRDVNILNALAVTYDELGRFDLSRAYYEEALALDPAATQTLNNYGRSLLRQRVAGPALAVLERAGARDGADYATLMENLAVARRQLARPDTPRAGGPGAASNRRPGAGPQIEMTALNERTLRTSDAPAGESPRPRDAAGGWPDAPPASVRPADLEVANGTGRPRMAARFAGYLGRHGYGVRRLLNADHFDHPRTEILFREGFEREARELAALLPVAVPLEQSRDISGDVRLRLGADLLDFDAALPAPAPTAAGRAG